MCFNQDGPRPVNTHGKTITRHFTGRMRANLAFERIEQNNKCAENGAYQ